ncbi:GEVED domain-containing protein [Nocardioides sp. LHG3406-4]|uniref:DUF7927 domain-containing protein n=1 Tax=Nocardioides sp. LHG3406-4 TaxID=2804575 RepID=UPI003CF4AA23
MKNSPHHPGKRAGHHRGRAARGPHRLASVVLTLLVLAAGLAVSAPAADAELSAQDPTPPIASDAGAEAGSSDAADPETADPGDEVPPEPGVETTEPSEPSADSSEEPAAPTDGKSTESTEETELTGPTGPTGPSGKSSQTSPRMAIGPLFAAGAPNTVEAGGTTYSAYVGAGESLTTSFTKFKNVVAGGSNTRFRITDPSGTVRSTCTVLGTQAVGATCVATDLTGPAGVWNIEVTALTNNPANWPQSGASHFTWTISVQNAAGTDIPGRVWTEKYRGFDASSATAYPLDFWVATEHGSQYKVDLNGFIGGGWAFDSTAYGLTQAGTCTPRYRSMDAVTNSPEYPPAPASCGDPYKLFFEPPAADLPATAATPTGPDWIDPPLSTPSVDDLEFAQAGGATRAGAFTYDLVDFTGAYRLQIDANNDGDYADAVDRDIPLGGSSGPQTYTWDGLDGAGDPIDSCQAINARVQIDQTDEVHFVLGDTEQLGGMTIEQLVGNAPGASKLYWDDRGVTGSPATPVIDGRAGVESDTPTGVHGWGRATAPAISWGDLSIIDNWTYSQVDINDAIALGVCALDLGDAPQSYGTLLAGSGPTGPSHAVADGIHLGASIDVESDGRPGPAADGDGADEDGVVFNPALGYASPTIRTGVDPNSQQPLSNTLEVEASAEGFVSVWVDFNTDGDFTDAGERVAHATPVNAGTNDITFSHAANPPGIQTYVRVRYSTDAVWVEDPTGVALDGEVEDYRVLVERLVQPDACTPSNVDHYAFTFGAPVSEVSNGGAVGTRVRYEDVSVIGGVPVDVVGQVVTGSLNPTVRPPDGFGDFAGAHDDVAWTTGNATIRYSFYEAGTTTPVDINGVFTVNDLDGTPTFTEVATFTASDLSAYAVTQGSAVVVTESGGNVVFRGTVNSNGEPNSRFQIVLEGLSSFESKWSGGSSSGFNFDGDGDIGVQPSCDDFGDAPNSYGTSLATNGPRHRITPGLFLGSEIDFDPNGQPGPGADGDDIDRIADEDGVEFNPGLGVAGGINLIQDGVQNDIAVESSSAGFLNAWVDFNQDGDFADAGERIASDRAVTAGPNAITMTVPATASQGATFARFRLTTQAGTATTPLGAAPDGEVEDYQVYIATPVPETCGAGLIDPGFEVPDIYGPTPFITQFGPNIKLYTDENVPGWNDVSGVVELWRDGTQIDGLPAVPAYEGKQFAEFGGGYYQDIATIPGTTLTWRFAHRGRRGTDTVRLMLGASPVPGQTFTSNSSRDVTTGNTGWRVYSGSYTIPAGQNVTRLQFQAIAAAGGQGLAVGNFLDAIELGVTCTDFGDAPASYGTTATGNGPRHSIAGYDATNHTAGLMIGSTVDIENDGVPSPGADGDDTADVADEDAFPGGLVLNPGVTNPTLTVPLTNRLGVAATLSGWIDSNNNGRFESSEHASVAVPVGATSAALAFSGLPALQDGTSPMVRLRLTTGTLTDDAGTPNVDERALGAAPDGEVEDHLAQVATLVPISCADPFVETFGTGAGYGPALPTGQTTYTYVGAPEPDNMIDDGDYAIVTSPRAAHTGWVVGADHTVGDTNGRMMLVNASFDEGTFFQRTFTGLAVGVEYDFSAYLTSVLSGSGISPNVTFQIVDPTTGTVLSSVDSGAIPNTGAVQWARYNMSFTAPQSTVRLELLNNAPGGGGNDLAIDDISFSPVCEFGDAPQSYGTLIGDDGPGHIATGPTLGTVRDTESDGRPSPGADGDDTTGTDDEDGIAGPIEMSVGAEASVTVSATNDSDKDVTLAGWIDLDGDGTFQDSERVTVTVPANSGTAAYQLDFPAGTTTTDTYARFRIYGVLMTDPQPTGTVAAGEVEDYRVTVLEPRLVIDKSSDATADARPGDEITYTVTATNPGPGDYTATHPARVWDDLSGVLDDATYNDDATSDRTPPDPVYANPILSWTGELPAGETVTITYTVTLKGGGDGTVRNVAFGQCDAADPGCDTTTPECDAPVGGIDPDTGKVCDEEEFELPKLTIAKASNRTDLPAVGQRVIYTVTVTNEGPGDYTATEPGTASDDLTKVLDDASIDTGTIDADVGTATFDSPNLEWTGVLADGESATITYEVVYNAGGDHSLVNNACVPVAQAQDPQDACATVTVPGSGLDQDKVADPASGSAVEVGQEITYTLRFANTGQTPATVDTFDDLTAVLDDADLVAGSIDAETGLTATYDAAAGERIDITGTVPVGDTLEVTYRVRVRPWAAQADHVLENALQCEAGDAPDCEPDVTEHRVRALDIEKTSDRTADTEIGDTVTYTVTGTNVGEADYTPADPARVWDDLTGVLDDATYNGNAATVPAGVGTITYGQPVISWVGELAKGDTVTLTYTVTLTGAGDLNVRNVAFGACDPTDPDCDDTTPVCDPPTAAGIDPVSGKPCAEEEFGLPDIRDAKTVDPADRTAVAAGAELTYELTFVNDGTAAGAVFKDDSLAMLLDDAEIITGPTVTGQGNLTATSNGGLIEVRGTLGAGETATVTYAVRVKPDGQRVADGGDDMLGNFLMMPGTTPPTACEPVAEEDSTCNPVSRIVDSKSVSPADRTAVRAGDELTYTLAFENLGQGAGPVSKDDHLGMLLDDADLMTPPGITVAGSGAVGVTATRNGQRIEIRGTLGAGEAVTVTYTVKVKPDAQRVADGGDDMLGNFLIDPTEPPPTACAPEADEDSTCNPVARIVDSKSVSPADRTAVRAGDELTYTLTFENLGQGAGPVSKDDYVGMWQDDAELVTPPGIQVTGAPGVAATLSGQRIEIRGTLGAQETATVTYTVKVKPDAQRVADGGDDMLGNFLIDPTEPPPTACAPEADEDSTCNPVARIVDSKSVTPADRTAVKAGEELTYTLTFENAGQGAGAVFKDDSLTMLLDDAELVTPPGIQVSGAAGVTATLNGELVEIRGTLQPTQVATVTYRVTVKPDAQRVADGGDDMLGNFLITPGTTPPTACELQAEEDSTCNPVSRIVDSKSVTPADRATVSAGDELTYTLTFQNLGQGAGAVDKDDYLGMLLDDATIVSGPMVAGQGNLTATRNGDRFEIRGTLAAGDVATVTYTVKVKPDVERQADGGDDLLGNFLVDPTDPPPPTQCEPEAAEDSTCNPVSRIADAKSVTPADRTSVEAGEELTYTLRFENLGQGAGQVSKDDSLGMLLDDATIVSGPTVAGQGNLTATLSGRLIEVRGTLGAGDLATVTYTVRVKSDAQRSADGGDDLLGNFLVPPGAEPPTECEPEADEDSTCNAVRALDIEKTSDRTVGTRIGDTVTYTVTAKNTGNGDYTSADPAVVRDDLAGVLDDATYDGNAAADKPGDVSYTAPVIEWSGALAVDEVVTLTYTVKLKAGGDLKVRNVAWGGGGPDPRCDPPTAPGFDPVTGKPCDREEFGLPDIVDDKQVDPKKGSPVSSGQLLTYTLTFSNLGTAPGRVAKVDNLSQVLDDATVVAQPVSSDPALTLSPIADGKLSVTGDLAPGQRVTVTYRVQVKEPDSLGDKVLGNHLLEPGQVPPTPGECLAQMGEDSTCNPVSDIVARKSVDPDDGSKVEGGDVLTYTLSFTNTGKGAGQVDYVDKMAGILDDTTLIKSPKSSEAAITASLKDGKVRIEGHLAGGQSVTVAYTVRVNAYDDQGDHVLANFLAAPGAGPGTCAAGDPMCTKNASGGTGGEGRGDGDKDGDGDLPDTGGPALAALLAGLALLLGGGLLLTVARRRREES